MNNKIKIQKTELGDGETRYTIYKYVKPDYVREVLFVCKEEDYEKYYKIALETLNK